MERQLNKTAPHFCNNLEELSNYGKWEEVFYCLNLNPHAVAKLPFYKMSDNYLLASIWLKCSDVMMVLLYFGFISSVILDHVMIFLILWYISLFIVRLFRRRIWPTISRFKNTLFMKLVTMVQLITRTRDE